MQNCNVLSQKSLLTANSQILSINVAEVSDINAVDLCASRGRQRVLSYSLVMGSFVVFKLYIST